MTASARRTPWFPPWTVVTDRQLVRFAYELCNGKSYVERARARPPSREIANVPTSLNPAEAICM